MKLSRCARISRFGFEEAVKLGVRAVSGRDIPMLNAVKMRFVQVADVVREGGWKSLLREVLFLKRTAIVVQKDLSEVADSSTLLMNAKLELVEIDRNMLVSGKYRFAVESRYLKALNYLKRGYGGYALARGNLVVGDTWHYISEATDDPRVLHEDLQRFGFKNWERNHVYTFDIFVAPGERKGGVSAAFQRGAMLSLRAKGYTKAYGFYWADNLPAQWCTRVTNKWKEVRAYKVSRFLIFKRAVLLLNDATTPPRQRSWLSNLSMGDKRKLNHGRTVDES